MESNVGAAESTAPQGEQNEDHKKLYIKLKVGQKVAYGLIDTANNFSWSYISSFLMIYLTDTFLIPASAVATMFLVCRFWDAVNDPIVGYLADRTKSRWGRFRPWIFFASAPLFITSALLFWPHPEWAMNAKLTYVYILYALVVLFYTMVNLTYGALNSVVTQDPSERGSLASYRLTFAVIGSTIMTQLVIRAEPALSANNPGMGYFYLAVIFAAVCIPLQIFGAKAQKEIVPRTQSKRKMNFFTQFGWSFRNIPFLMVCIMFLCQGFSNYGVGAINAYWFKYIMGDLTPMATFGLITVVPMLLGTFTAQFWANKFRSKRTAIGLFLLLGVLINAVQYFVFLNSVNAVLLYVLGAFMQYFNGAYFSLIYGMVPDTIEYSELLTKGQRMDGFLNTLSSFWNKVGITLGTAGAGWILGAIGYVPNAAVQLPIVVSWLQILKWIMPALFNIIALLCLIWYKLDYAKFDSMVKELNEKRPIWAKEEANL